VKASSTSDTRPVLVTGGAGFIGCNLVDRLCRDGHRVVVYDSLARPGVDANAEWLRGIHAQRFEMVVGDVRDQTRLAPLVAGAKAVFHLAAQVAVTTSLAGPAEDFAVNAAATVGLLEMLRATNREAPLVFASTNKVYGDLAHIPLAHEGDTYLPRDAAVRRDGVAETVGLAFHTPYGCSKGAADQYVLDYGASFGLRTAAMRMSCIYGPHQMGTEDQGWVAHFIRRAIARAPITIYGDGHQVRDVLHVDDAVEAYVTAFDAIDEISGQAFNLGGGPANAISLVQLLAHIEAVTGETVDASFHAWRPGDQRYYVSDRRLIDSRLKLPPPRPWRRGVGDLIAWFEAAESVAVPAEVA
jgi:CDP-paratose 2-epimerase